MLQYRLSPGLATILVNLYRDMNTLIFSIDASFHFLKRKGRGNSEFTACAELYIDFFVLFEDAKTHHLEANQ